MRIPFRPASRRLIRRRSGCRPAAPSGFALGALVVAALGCGESPRGGLPKARIQGVVDSTFPIEEEVRRFVATIDSMPSRLRDGADSREGLVKRFVRAVEQRDTLELPRLVLQRDEFIALYYPHTHFTAPPHELSPALLWFQMQNRSSRGITRLVQRDGGRNLGYVGIECPAAPREQERNRLWEGCVVRVQDSLGMERRRRLFGTILERDATWKFLTFANEY